ncbi:MULTISPECIES: ABC transporter substrate-binding protein [unclassified Azospirillum]|uniref:substrate-binding periplasmic protein n=1 Tax=unclassified Azospirillum TaxID=2630922 RepID=UPI000B66F221|nr:MULTISPECIES: transporter substrate-binding domain-containing protein [unclassified Azospirillum]SNR96370.1 amino acid ABC transporter substrate-binding protein, PAAT family [Azospirillum sp. RU38E]SNS13234.1 amino acid ABC transporter substrate-binding protein, PAAT family [Azospirillum sp. RU37A]
MSRFRLLALMIFLALSGLAATAQGEAVRFGLREAAPMVLLQPDGRLAGLEYEIIQAVMQAAGMELVPYLGSNARLAVAADGKAVEAFAPVVGQPPQGVTLTDSYLTYQNVAMSLRERRIKLERMADLGRYRVLAFQRATQTLGPEFAAAVAGCPFYREEPKQALQAAGLLYERYDVLIADARILRHHLGPTPVTEHRLFAPSPYSAGFRDPAQAARFNEGLRRIKADGTYAAILARYPALPDDPTIN